MIVSVLTSIGVEALNKTFSYVVPEHLKEKAKVGCRVLIPFGPQRLEGFILKIDNKSVDEFEYKLKNIIDVVDDFPVLNNELLNLGEYISKTTFCTLINAYQVMLPTALKAKEKNNISIKTKSYISLNQKINIIKEYINNNQRSKRQIELLESLLKNDKLEKSLFDSAVVKTLVEKDLIKVIIEEVYRFKNNVIKENKKIVLTEKQQEIANEIIDNLNNDITYLLYGVTGSGKTEVYIEVIKKVIEDNKQVIMLVPEISLTPQMVNRFTNVFGDKIAVLHSGLSNGEKYDEYRKILNDEVDIVIGARSAIFAPFKKLGAIIIDEEHTSSYKQDNHPRYHAIDIAKVRSKTHSCPLILGSATPSLESYARAKKGVYKLLELKTRVGKSKLPIVKIVDMKDEIKQGNSTFSKELSKDIKDRLEKGEQIILLLNRRGYSTFVTCKDCGFTHKCPNCDISLTYHKTTNTMRCHYCGYGDKMLYTCPECGGRELKNLGTGTQKIEEELNLLYPNARIIRMDVDTTSKKGSHEKIINDFKQEKYDILLGTQMIAKGLDFPKVTLVGVINADTSLNIPDFRSGERTFELLSQVAGRAGRSDMEGKVVIQTYNPEHYSINYTRSHDYEAFYQREMFIRKQMSYPPYYYITLVRILSKDYVKGMEESRKISDYLKKHLNNDTIVLGPTTSIMYKINNVYRYQCIIKYKKDDKLNDTLIKIINHYKINKNINVEIDNNPNKL
ncbi:MAG: primosomal protein N' [Bacilli bacterium]|nr:primosomal protein N' [Bacilli bacterium]